MAEHEYTTTIAWTGDRGQGTSHYRAYDRTWRIAGPGKMAIDCSNDPLLGGDSTKYNPEELLLSALSACHMLWYLHLAAEAGITVRGYQDRPLGIGETAADGSGRFLRVTLRPVITVEAGEDLKRADQLHHEVHNYCFIARSVNFPISFEPAYDEA